MKMKKRKNTEQSLHWLPIDSRLVSPLLSFSHVHGVAKVFLIIEMVLAFSVVCGTFMLLVFRLVI